MKQVEFVRKDEWMIGPSVVGRNRKRSNEY